MDTNMNTNAIEALRRELHGEREATPTTDCLTAAPVVPAGPYPLSYFTELPPEAFVEQAYRAVLHREADPPGRAHYLAALGIGTLSRVEILDGLCRSEEGRAQGVVINGLTSCMRWHRMWHSIPLLGKGIRFIRRLLSVPSLLRMCSEMVRHQQDLLQRVTGLEDRLRILDAHVTEQNLRHHRAEIRLDNLDSSVSDIRLETRRAVAEYRRYLLDLEPKTDAASGSVGPLTSVAPPAFSDSLYASFEDEFRGSPAEVRQGLSPYLPFVREVAAACPQLPVIDLGCGRGEWLELLIGERIPAKGVDRNPAVVIPLIEQGFDIVQADIFPYLASLSDASASVITSFHLIEHLSPDHWLLLLDEIRRVLAPGGLAIIETPNPRNILVGAGDFYRDPSHNTPVFPDTLRFFGQSRGFDQSGVYYFADGRSSLVPGDSWRFDSLDDYVRISRDYAWIGRKNK